MKKLFVAVLVLLAAFSIGPAPSFAAKAASKAVEFSAEFVESDGGEMTSGSVYIGDGVSRLETNGGREIVVTRQDKKVIWLIFPRAASYVEQEYIGEPQMFYIDPTAPATDNVKREFMGYEWIDSYRLRKFLVSVAYPGGVEDKYYEWFRDNFPVPVKTASLDGKTWFEYRKIKIGPQNPDLFVTPKRYKKVTMEDIIAAEEQRGEEKKK